MEFIESKPEMVENSRSRAGHRRSHGLGIGPGQSGVDQDSGEIHVGQVADRQPGVGHDAENRAETMTRVVMTGPSINGAQMFISSPPCEFEHGSREQAETAHRSPPVRRAKRRFRSRLSPPMVMATVTGRDSTVMSGYHKDKQPCCPV